MKYLVLFFLSISLSFASSYTFETFPREFQTVTLPLPYKEMTLEEARTTIFVPERAYTVLDDATPQITAVVGSISPCVFIGIRNNRSGRTIVAHKHYSNNLHHLFGVSKQELGSYEPQDIIAKLYTYNEILYCPIKEEPFWDELEDILGEKEVDEIYGDIDEEYEVDISAFEKEEEEIRKLHNGRNQKEELDFIKAQLIHEFNITNEAQVFTQVFTDTYKEDLGFYSLVEETVHTDSYLNVSNIAPIKENILRDYSQFPLNVEGRYAFHLFEAETLRLHIINKYNNSYPDDDVLDKALDTNNLLPFQKFNIFGPALHQLLQEARHKRRLHNMDI
ncbi:hypothetical protein [Candidatus Odyssella acanthamoebae]|uniref:Uncharacterized protein n=1 Tax=Candidatus Odyssella acanthamoebae TaxID=91604 RepID=A0A077AZ45_9PROT|nr:hypothetical protein [Candidatus Paracaedibacter acanthamoebae]AIK95975.1 hypothetical protein ID47_03300 [Candidatus Paracaedibacter acanthamoebae]